MAGKRKGYNYRSAKTGRYVKKATNDRHSNETVRERKK